MPPLLIDSADVARYLPWPETIAAVEQAFLAAGAPFGALPIHVEGGGFHVKAGALGRYFAAKVNGNFPGNPARGLPTIRGLVLLCDATNGEPLAVMDSAELTRRRTAAATAVAARHLSREGSSRLAVIGCGVQAGATIEALRCVRALAAVVPDVLAQAAEFGDLHHALAAGAMRREDVRGELGAVIAGRERGRASNEEIVIFDSTGMGLQDVAAAALVYEAATRP